jgi:putative sigma-54 modulation protein
MSELWVRDKALTSQNGKTKGSAVQSSITVTNVELDETLRQFIERRVQFALSRFGPRIRRVSIGLTKEIRPTGGTDSSCQIVVTLERSEHEVIEVHGLDMQSAVTHALERASRSVQRKLARQRS